MTYMWFIRCVHCFLLRLQLGILMNLREYDIPVVNKLCTMFFFIITRAEDIYAPQRI